MSAEKDDTLYVISAIGYDKPGLISSLTAAMARANVNIVDIDQTVLHGLFAMYMIVDVSAATETVETMQEYMVRLAERKKLEISVEPYPAYVRKKGEQKKELLLVTFVGKDRPGIIAGFSKICTTHKANIARMRMIARGDVITMEMLVDNTKATADDAVLKKEFHELGTALELGVIVQHHDAFKKSKRLVVFDLDNTLIRGEIIDKLAKVAGVEDRVEQITHDAMEGKLDFAEALRERVTLLKGLDVCVLERIAESIEYSEGVQDLLFTLKEMGCRVAVVSGGFTIFTDRIRNELGLDYAFANELGIKDGVLTGEVVGPIIDARGKENVLRDLMRREKISEHEIIAIGDGANDMHMLKSAGIGIAFNAKELVKKVADGVLTKDQLRTITHCLSEYSDY